jgi:DNA-binding MarR family transcriptional regulator
MTTTAKLSGRQTTALGVLARPRTVSYQSGTTTSAYWTAAEVAAELGIDDRRATATLDSLWRRDLAHKAANGDTAYYRISPAGAQRIYASQP